MTPNKQETTKTNNNTTTTIKAALFDLDGTILDTESLSDHAVLLALQPHMTHTQWQNYAVQTNYQLPWELKRQMLGLRGSEWAPMVIRYVQQYWNVETSNVTVQLLWNQWEQHLNQLCPDVKACPGATKLVQALAKQNIALAIATSSRHNAVQKKRTHHESSIFRYISTIVTGEDVAHGKPAPDIYLEAARRLGVQPSECVAFEDAASGVASARAAGCAVVVAVPDPRYTQAEARALFGDAATVILSSLEEFDGQLIGISNQLVE